VLLCLLGVSISKSELALLPACLPCLSAWLLLCWHGRTWYQLHSDFSEDAHSCKSISESPAFARGCRSCWPLHLLHTVWSMSTSCRQIAFWSDSRLDITGIIVRVHGVEFTWRQIWQPGFIPLWQPCGILSSANGYLLFAIDLCPGQVNFLINVSEPFKFVLL